MSHTRTEQKLIAAAALEQFFAEVPFCLKPEGPAVSERIHPSANSRASSDQTHSEHLNTAALEQLFAEVGFRVDLAIATQAAIDQKLATEFNVFTLIEPDENKMSDILSELLNPRGNHGQGDLFLCLLCRNLGIFLPQASVAAVQVQREALTHRIPNFRRRMDILIEAPGLLLAFENKINSGEQHEQVLDYLEHLTRHRSTEPTRSLLIYLTRSGEEPESLSQAQAEQFKQAGLLRCWSYTGELCDWLVTCRQLCEAEKIRYFLSDLMSYIHSTIQPFESNDYDN